MNKKLSFRARLKIFAKRKDAKSYGLEEYLDDCYRHRLKLLGHKKTPKGGSTNCRAWLQPDTNAIALITDHLDDFEAWLRLQL
jgi:hypothetical protein